MEVRCPQCFEPLSLRDLPDEEMLSDLSCQSCGSTFSLSGDDATITHQYRDPDKKLGRFQLLERLGVGAYGEVWKAHDTQLDRVVALKMPRKEHLSEGDVEQFLREATAAAQLTHPHIVAVHEIGRAEDRLFIVSDFIEGVSLSDWLTGCEPTIQQSVEITRTIADALDFAHRSGVIHRDIKPSNLILDLEHRPHITDFGLARRESVDKTLTAAGEVLGTPAYMPPEQARGEGHSADQRADIYSVGVILFQLLTGECPFRGNTRMLLHQVLNEVAPSPRSLNPDVPRDLETIVAKCLEKPRERRYQSAGELRDELDRFLRGEPIQARPITRPEVFWRLCKRNPVVAALSFGLVLAFLIGFIGITTQWRRAVGNAERANVAAERAEVAGQRERESREMTERYLYVARMNLAQQAVELAEASQALEILLPYSDKAIDPRGFEWYYWRHRALAWEHNWQTDEQEIFAVAVAPNNRWFAAAGASGEVHVYETETGKPAYRLSLDGAPVYSLAFSPDSEHLAAGGRGAPIKIWSMVDGKLDASLAGHEGTVFGLQYFPDGRRLATAGSDTKVRVWDLDEEDSVQVLSGHIDFVYTLKISRDGKHLASAGLDRQIILWDLDSQSARRKLNGHQLEVWALDFNHDATRIASGSGDQTIRIWDVETAEVVEVLRGHQDRVRGVQYSADSRFLVSTGFDRTVKLWDFTRPPTQAPDVPFRNLKRRPLHFYERMSHPHGRLSATGLETAPTNAVTITPDATSLLTACRDGTVKRWSLKRLLQRDVIQDHKGSVNCVAFLGKQQFVTASNDRTVRIWSLPEATQDGESIQVDGRVLSLAVAPDQRRIITGTFDGKLNLWDLQSRKKPLFSANVKGPISCLAFSPDGKIFASVGHDHQLRIWDGVSADPIAEVEADKGRVYHVVFLSDASLLTAGEDGVVKRWSDQGEKLGEFQAHQDAIWCQALSPDGKLLATGGADRVVRIWSTETWEQVRELRGHTDVVHSLAFAPDARTLASGSADKTIKFWDHTVGVPKSTLKDHSHNVWSLAFSSDGAHMVSGSLALRLWRAPRTN